MACSSPPGIANGQLVNSQASYSRGSTAQYTCNTAYSMTGSSTLSCVQAPTPSSGSAPYVWQGAYPVCKLEFLETGDPGQQRSQQNTEGHRRTNQTTHQEKPEYRPPYASFCILLISLLAGISWKTLMMAKIGRRRKVRDAEDVEDDQSECSRLWCCCCFYCMRTPGNTKDGCCDYFGCCGYAGCCSCCCWCCRCCREIVEPENKVRVRHIKQKHRPIFSMKRQKTLKSKNKKKKMAMLKLSSQQQIVKGNLLPTTRMVRSMIQDDPKLFRKVAKTLPEWMPHTNTVRNINTSTK